MTNKNKVALNIIEIILLGVVSIVFCALFFGINDGGFLFNNKILFTVIISVILLFVVILGIFGLLNNKEVLFKVSFLVLILTAISVISIYFLKITGTLDKIRTVEQLRAYVASFGAWAAIIYIILNILQVVVLPIPGFVAVASGVALFGPHLATLYSFIGIIIGSFIGFFIGKYLGYKVVTWLVGKETLDKWLNAVKNKDRIVLTFMFLFPMFPDDVLCFVAGLSSMSTPYFMVMVTISRILTISVTSYSVNGSLIPYNTWWGLLIWAIIIIFTVIATVLVYKNGDKIEQKFVKLFRKKTKGVNNENDITR